MKAAVIDKNTNIVINVIVADAYTELAPDGYYLVDVTDVFCDIGYNYDPTTQTFSPEA